MHGHEFSPPPGAILHPHLIDINLVFRDYQHLDFHLRDESISDKLFQLVESMLSAMLDDALGNIRLVSLFDERASSLPVTRSLIWESVAQRKTPMLDLAPTQRMEVVSSWESLPC